MGRSFLFIAAVFVVLGVAALVIGFRASAAKHELAVELEHRGAWWVGIGAAMALGVWGYRRWFD